MQYFEAVRVGRKRADAASEVLRKYAGVAVSTMIVKEDPQEGWLPVGEENFVALIGQQGGAAMVALCDAEGYSKALCRSMSPDEAKSVVERMKRDGVPELRGAPRLPV